MADSPAETSAEIPAPRANSYLIGRAEAESQLLRAWRSHRMPHAWLFAGPRGIGKATLAYRFARFVLAEGAAAAANADQAALFGGAAGPPPDSIMLDPGHPVFRRVAAGGHPDLFVLERGLMHPDTKRPTNEIVVPHVRRVNEQLRLTPVEGGWRVTVIDEAEAMNSNAANAFLKLLEEPPARALIILISHAPGRLLPTIRSRCRVLALPPLASDEVDSLLGRYRPDLAAEDRATLVRLGEGSVGRAIELEARGGVELYGELLALLGKLPKLDAPALHTFSERMARRGADSAEDAAAGFRTTIELLSGWIGRLAKFAATNTMPTGWEPEKPLLSRLGQRGPLPWLAAEDRVKRLGSATEGVNLDRRQALIAAFLAIEQAALG
jgi:DNA polymerase-3 subunit delta'